MKVENIEISKLSFAEYNPRTITEAEFDGLTKSISTFGLVEPIVVNKDYTIIGGHQRVRACQRLGMTTVPCNIVDLSKKQEKKLNVILNSHAISGNYDDIQLAELLLEFKNDEDYTDLRLDKLEQLDLSNLEAKGDEIENKLILRVYVDCEDEIMQEKVFNDIQTLGYDVKIIQI